jgi:diguanylate cyclase (GGDEF)-like protein
MIDLDYFKKYNDSYGHPQGDSLLINLAQLFKHTAKRSTDLVARLGGEEFAVLLPDTGLIGGIHLANRLNNFVEQQDVMTLNGREATHITISCGVHCIYPEHDIDINLLVATADENLYNAKELGRNQVYPKLEDMEE